MLSPALVQTPAKTVDDAIWGQGGPSIYRTLMIFLVVYIAAFLWRLVFGSTQQMPQLPRLTQPDHNEE